MSEYDAFATHVAPRLRDAEARRGVFRTSHTGCSPSAAGGFPRVCQRYSTPARRAHNSRRAGHPRMVECLCPNGWRGFDPTNNSSPMIVRKSR